MSEHFNHFDQKVWYLQSVDIPVLYIKSNFLRLHCGTIMLQTKSNLKFWCNISTNWSNCKNWFCSRKKTLLVQGRKLKNIGVEQEKFELCKSFWKMLKYFNNFEHPDIWSNLRGNYLNSLRDSNKKRINGTRNNKKRLLICPFLWNISTILSIQISDRILKKIAWFVSETQIRNEYMEQETRRVLWSVPFVVIFQQFSTSKYLLDISTSCFLYTFRKK